MLRVLVVDDEPMSLRGISRLIGDSGDFEVLRAESGHEALSKMEMYRVDILVSDIEMPGIDGLGLLTKVKERCPFAKVIMLTAYDDFSYIQTSMRLGADAYVLKSDGDAAIVSALSKCAGEIEKELENKTVIEENSRAADNLLPFLQNSRLLSILEWMDRETAADAISETRLDFDVNKKTMLVYVSMSGKRNLDNSSRRFFAMERVIGVAEHHLSSYVKCFHATYDDQSIMFLLQPQSQSQSINSIYSYVKGMLELIQEQVYKTLHLSLGIIYDNFVEYDDIHKRSDRLHLLMSMLPLKDEDRALVDSLFLSESLFSSERTIVEETLAQEFQFAISSGNKDEVSKTIDDIFSSDDLCHTANLIAIWHLLSGILVEMYSNGHWEDLINDKEGFVALCSYQGISRTHDVLLRLALHLIDLEEKEESGRKGQLISAINNYISLNLHSSLSLSEIADCFHMNPSYLSRFYKQETGLNISDFIMSQRIRKAKKLLERPEFKINEIAQLSGFESSSYFSRAFRKSEGLSPQEWRDAKDVK